MHREIPRQRSQTVSTSSIHRKEPLRDEPAQVEQRQRGSTFHILRRQFTRGTSTDQDSIDGGQEERDIWRQYLEQFPGEERLSDCKLSACVIRRGEGKKEYQASSGWHDFNFLLTNFSIHLSKQRRIFTSRNTSSLRELTHSYPLASLKGIEPLDGTLRLQLCFTKTNVKLRFADEETFTRIKQQIDQAHETILKQRDQENELRRREAFANQAEAGSQSTIGTTAKTTVQRDLSTSSEYGIATIGRMESVLIKLRLRPHPVYQPTSTETCHALHEKWATVESEKPMIKYPSVDSFFSLPSEYYFKLDSDHVVLLWKSPIERHYNPINYITLDHILELRRGQQTINFKKFPYNTKSQSFSIIFEGVKKVLVFGAHHYTVLQSLDLVCEKESDVVMWIDALQKCHFNTYKQLFPKQLKWKDHTLIWLKANFSLLSVPSRNEITKDKVNRFIRMIFPTIDQIDMDRWFLHAKSCQLNDTVIPDALTWYGFISVHDSLVMANTERLKAIFKEYALENSEQGMTIEEFRSFLLYAQGWPADKCTHAKCRRMIDRYDSSHLVHKQVTARKHVTLQNQGKTSALHLSMQLSLPGFISFLRGADNQIIDPDHEMVYQDMDQPLSHYFINSSHNTYLEGHQLRGLSTYDAYIRPLMLGCRCLELDCWDGEEIGEISVTHGGTPTSKLSFKKVLLTIKEYAFEVSEFPLILSLENHCNKLNRNQMAILLQQELGQFLWKETIETFQKRSSLPSPNQLKRKILLKDSFRYVPEGNSEPSQFQAATLPPPSSDPPQIEIEPNPTLSLPEPCSLDCQINEEPSNAVLPLPKQHFQRFKSHEPLNEGKVTFQSLISYPPTAPLSFDPPQPPISLPNPPSEREGCTTRSYQRRIKQELTPSWRFAAYFQGEDVLKELKEKLDNTAEDEDSTTEDTMTSELSQLIHCRAQRIRSPCNWWTEYKKFQLTDMVSFREDKAQAATSNQSDLLKLSQNHLIRVYPKGSRVGSDNYNPIPFWNYGMHLVSLNYQTPDVFMHVNQGRFRENGNCGYILKPCVLRRSCTFTPDFQDDIHKINSPHPEIAPLELMLKFISGQNLAPKDGNIAGFKIWVTTFGVDDDTRIPIENFTHMNCPGPLFEGNGNMTCFFDFPQKCEFMHKVLIPDLALLYIRVEVQEGSSLGRRPGPKLFGQNVIPVNSLKQGYRFIPLRNECGKLLHESGLFVCVNFTFSDEITNAFAATLEENNSSLEHQNNAAIHPQGRDMSNSTKYNRLSRQEYHVEEEINYSTDLSELQNGTSSNGTTQVEVEIHKF